MIVLSGGTQAEVLQLLADRGLSENFDGVYGGPKNKEENLQGLSLKSLFCILEIARLII